MIAEHQDVVVEEGAVDLLEMDAIDRGEVDPADLGTEGSGKSYAVDRHVAPPGGHTRTAASLPMPSRSLKVPAQ